MDITKDHDKLRQAKCSRSLSPSICHSKLDKIEGHIPPPTVLTLVDLLNNRNMHRRPLVLVITQETGQP